MNVTALTKAAFTSTGSHVGRLDPAAPLHSAYKRFAKGFNEERYRTELSAKGLGFEERLPLLLEAIDDPPAGLFTRGNASLLTYNRPMVAVVGARAATIYGLNVANSIARELAGAGFIIVSGLARGVDTAAHNGAFNDGRTVAVLGCGIDRDYPAANSELARKIVDNGGLIVSEYAMGVEPAPWRFPARNRIVAGLCVATVVVEARERSGALITANLAIDEGRDVYAVPGGIRDATSYGTNELISSGRATCVHSIDSLVEQLRGEWIASACSCPPTAPHVCARKFGSGQERPRHGEGCV